MMSIKNDIGIPTPPASPACECELPVIKRIPKPEYPIQVYQGSPIAASEEHQRRLMRWRYNSLEYVPFVVWLMEPNLERIKEVAKPHLQGLFPALEDIEVELLAQGGFNKVYTITARSEKMGKHKTFIFRVAVPVYPYYRLESEVATMELVRSSTSVPVPIVYAYDSNPYNSLGYEWMMMEKVNGRQVYDLWEDWDWDSKLGMTKKVALWTSQLANITSNKIGSIFMRYLESNLEFYVGRSIQGIYFNERNLWCEVPRGPFGDLESYYRASLALQKYENSQWESDATQPKAGKELEQMDNDKAFTDVGASSDELQTPFPLTEDTFFAQADRDDAEFLSWKGRPPKYFRSVIERIAEYEAALPSLLDPAKHKPIDSITSLSHHDMSLQNIFADESGNLIALLDWEHIGLEPLHFRTIFPKYLSEGDDIDYEPQRENYGCTEDYKLDMEDYEKDLLRDEFQAELKWHDPALAEEAWSDRLKYWGQLCYQICNVEELAFGPEGDWIREQLNTKSEEDEDDEEEEEEDEDAKDEEEGEEGEDVVTDQGTVEHED